MREKQRNRIKFNRAISNILTPIGGLEYKKKHFRIGDILGEVFNKISTRCRNGLDRRYLQYSKYNNII